MIRPDVYRRADPMIYSQFYLMEQGLAVTWDNPDAFVAIVRDFLRGVDAPPGAATP